LGDPAYREDAVERIRYCKYVTEHHRSWLEFAIQLGYDLSLSDLILVYGCDKTSQWACAAWSEQTQSVSLSFVAGVPGIAEGGARVWGEWISQQSLDQNVGPRPLVPSLEEEGNVAIQRSSHSSNTTSTDQAPPMATTSRTLSTVPHAFLINVYLYADIKWGIDPRGLSARRRELTSEAVSRSFQSLWIPRGKQAATGPKSKGLRRLQALLKMTHHLRPLEGWTSNIGARTEMNLPIQMAEARQALTRLIDFFIQYSFITVLTSPQISIPVEVLIGYIFEVCRSQYYKPNSPDSCLIRRILQLN
jgi:hypothetical protein